MGRYDFQRKPDRMYRMGWGPEDRSKVWEILFPVPGFPPACFSPQTSGERELDFCSEVSSRFHIFRIFFQFFKVPGRGFTRPLLPLVPGW